MKNPIKPSIKSEIVPVVFLIFVLGLAFYFYNNFPDTVPVHWNIQGEPDNYAPRWVGALMMPSIIFLIYVMFLFIPFIDPKRKDMNNLPRYIMCSKVHSFFLCPPYIF